MQARAAECVAKLTAVSQLFYAMKANGHPDILKIIAAEGVGIECVSAAELRHARAVLGDAVPLLFTPNFCPVEEYAVAYELGADVTVDGPDVLLQCPDVFRGRKLAVRVDPGRGDGHHQHVVTAGPSQKFGHPSDDMVAFADTVVRIGATVVGLHAHVGSGVKSASNWAEVATALAAILPVTATDGTRVFESVEWMDVGGGIGVATARDPSGVSLDAVNDHLKAVPLPAGVQLRMEPGRFFVSEAGVLVAPVTQVRRKGGP